MGWDTKIIVIGQSFSEKERAKEASKRYFEIDGNSSAFENYFYYVIPNKNDFDLMIIYERRKGFHIKNHLDFSGVYNDIIFTFLGNEVDFLGGPGGVLKIKYGKVIDNYGIGINTKRLNALSYPLKNLTFIYQWFKMDGGEEKQRDEFADAYPYKEFCFDNYMKKIIPINEDVDDFKSLLSKKNDGIDLWEFHSALEFLPSKNECEEIVNKNSIIQTEGQAWCFLTHNKSFILYKKYLFDEFGIGINNSTFESTLSEMKDLKIKVNQLESALTNKRYEITSQIVEKLDPKRKVIYLSDLLYMLIKIIE